LIVPLLDPYVSMWLSVLTNHMIGDLTFGKNLIIINNTVLIENQIQGLNLANENYG